MTHDDKLVRQALGEDFTRNALAELGLGDTAPEARGEVMKMLGESIARRIVLEVLTALPEDARDEFESLIGGGDVQALNAFLSKHIDDPMGFMHEYASQEYETIKAQLHSARQGR